MSENNYPSFKEAVWFWIKLGFISFGGPAGQIAIMHEFLVTKKKWISEGRFMHALNYSMILPGPEAQQLATYSGWLLHGTKGGLAAGIFFILPSMLILFALSAVYAVYGSVPWIYALFNGLKPAVIAIVIMALYKISSKSLKSMIHWLIAVLSFVAMFFLNIGFPIIIIASLILSFLASKFIPSIINSTTEEKSFEDENDYIINENHTPEQAVFKPLKTILQVLTAVIVWSIPILLFNAFSGDTNFWNSLIFFFTKAAFITFGGAYAVLPYVADVAVENFNWLSELQMIDGLALGETTPGPLVMVLAYVGFMAGYNHFGASVAMGGLGLVITTFYTFVPCFLFIFAGAPIIERTRNNDKIKNALTIVTAAVVGVILNLTIYLTKAVVWTSEITFSNIDWVVTVWILVSFVALQRFKVNMILWIGISAIFGVSRYFLGI